MGMLDSLIYENIVTYTSEALLVASPVCNTGMQILDFSPIYMNKAYEIMTNKRVEIDSLFSKSMVHVSASVPWIQMGQEAFETGKHIEHSFFSQVLNSWFFVSLVKLPQDFLLVTLHDISKDKEHEQQLRRQNLRLAALSEELVLSRQNLRNKLDKIENLNIRLEHLAFHDPLTGLPNRSRFNEIIELSIQKSKKEHGILGLMLIDIDNLKDVNDSRGHSAGDELLCRVSKQLKNFVRETIQVFRFGGDEFLVLATELETKDSMVTISDAIMESVNSVNVSISAGISLFPDDTDSIEELLKFADMAMYDVKKKGKNNVFFFMHLMQDKLLKRLNLETKLNEAMLNGSFKLYYQPQVDITTNKLRGFEALLRWYDDEIGWISPEQFIPLAEESRLVIPLGDWVMDTACATLRNWIDTYNFDGIMSINVSPIQLKKTSFIYDLDETIKKYSLDPRKIEIEVTEGVLIENMEETVRLLQDVKNLGVGISLDDFGTGYSSLSYLQILPLTTLKIDKSFIANITSKNSVEAEITDSIISLVTKMGLDTIAEGVENAEQLGVLQQINCRNTQGFLMGKPMPVDICEKMLSGDESAILRIENGQDPIRYSI